METLGVYVQNQRFWPPSLRFSMVVASTYSWRATLDTMLVARATHLRLVLDPIEARVAFFEVDGILKFLQASGMTTSVAGLEKLREARRRLIPSAGAGLSPLRPWPKIGVTAGETHQAIEATFRIERVRLIAGLARIVVRPCSKQSGGLA
jgi:hypothetical protein